MPWWLPARPFAPPKGNIPLPLQLHELSSTQIAQRVRVTSARQRARPPRGTPRSAPSRSSFIKSQPAGSILRMILQAGKLKTSCSLPIKSKRLSAWNHQGQRDLAAHASSGKCSQEDVPLERGDVHMASLCIWDAGVSPKTWLSPSPDPLKGFAKHA